MENFIKEPNIPRNSVSLAIVDGRVSGEIEKKLVNMEIRLIKTKKIEKLYPAISYHPDIMMNHIGGDEIIAAPNIHNSIVYALEDEGFKVLEGRKHLDKKYPLDIPYNTAVFGKYAVCNVRHTDEILLDKLYEKGLKILNVKQGYAKCSICVINDNAVVTSDRGIHNILSENNINSILITPGYVKLFEMNYGFIGGASGKISSSEIAFLGDINLHPDYCKIKKFLKEHGSKPVSLSRNMMIDLGTLIPLKEYNVS